MKNIKAMVLLAGMVLSTGALACPNEVFQRQDGNFKWVVSGSFNHTPFSYGGRDLGSLVTMIERYRAILARADKAAAAQMFVPL